MVVMLCASAIAIVLLTPVPALAQSALDPFGPRIPQGPGVPGIPGSGALREVDPGYADIDPLRRSLYNTGAQADLRTPVGFDRVYIGADGRYYRISGSLVAAFDRSQYVADANGVYPQVPAGTIYYTDGLPPEAIGDGRPLESVPTARLRADDRLTNRVNGSARERAGSPRHDAGVGGIAYRSGSKMPLTSREREEAPAEPTMVTDEAYRAARMAVLLRNATRR